MQRRHAGLRFGIIRRSHEHEDPTHAFDRLRGQGTRPSCDGTN
jgi:hypothetical protein